MGFPVKINSQLIVQNSNREIKYFTAFFVYKKDFWTVL